MKKKIVSLIAIISFSLLNLGIASAKTIKIGTSDWPGWVAWYIAKEKGLFKKAGVEVEIVWFNTYSDSISALSAGQLDANSQTLSDTLGPLSKKIPLKIILVNDNSAGNDAIVVKSGIKSLKELKGKTVAVEIGAIDHFLLLYALKKAGMKSKDISVVNMTTQDAAAAFITGHLDAAAVWQPWISRIVASKKGNTIFTSKETPGLVPDLLVARAESVKNNRRDYVKIAKTWFKVVDFIKNNELEASKIMAKVVGISAKEYKKFLVGTKFFGPAENLEALTLSKDVKSLYVSGKQIGDFLISQKLLRSMPSLKNAIDASIVQSAAK